MSLTNETVVGIDVGGMKEGFHAIALRAGVFEKMTSTDPAEIVEWCLNHKAKVVAVDAPCGWSETGRSRQAERDLALAGRRIQCFMTPTRAQALANTKGFFAWVFNGERLYQLLARNYPVFDGKRHAGPCSVETFPHGIVCCFSRKVVPAIPKVPSRRKALIDRGFDITPLTNIDFIDAGLCAVAAREFRQGRFASFGRKDEGFIVLPGCERQG